MVKLITYYNNHKLELTISDIIQIRYVISESPLNAITLWREVNLNIVWIKDDLDDINLPLEIMNYIDLLMLKKAFW